MYIYNRPGHRPTYLVDAFTGYTYDLLGTQKIDWGYNRLGGFYITPTGTSDEITKIIIENQPFLVGGIAENTRIQLYAYRS